MCTVTFLPISESEFVLTSNRDEQRTRQTLAPERYTEDSVDMLYPKDTNAGGTWIGLSSKKRLVCVLNGGFVKHKRKKSYRKSRGVIAKEILKSANLKKYVEKLNLNGVEPFTMVIVNWYDDSVKLSELVWDEKTVHFKELPNSPRIWSSSTLYTPEIKKVRKDWFDNWVKKHDFTSKNILDFHHLEKGDKQQTILMKRPYVETVSITSIAKTADQISMQYDDLVHGRLSIHQF